MAKRNKYCPECNAPILPETTYHTDKYDLPDGCIVLFALGDYEGRPGGAALPAPLQSTTRRRFVL